MRKKIFYAVSIIIVATLSIGWFTKYVSVNEVPVGWRGLWISNSYDSFDDYREKIFIEKDALLWQPRNGNSLYMPLKAIRIPRVKDVKIEFQYEPHRHGLVPPEDRWHPISLMEDSLIRIYCPFCDKAHTFTKGNN